MLSRRLPRPRRESCDTHLIRMILKFVLMNLFASFCSKENILGDSKMLMRDVSLPPLKSSLLMGDVLQALGDRRR